MTATMMTKPAVEHWVGLHSLDGRLTMRMDFELLLERLPHATPDDLRQLDVLTDQERSRLIDAIEALDRPGGERFELLEALWAVPAASGKGENNAE